MTSSKPSSTSPTWLSICNTTLSSLQASLTSHRVVSQTYFDYITKYLTLNSYHSVALTRNLHSQCAYAACLGRDNGIALVGEMPSDEPVQTQKTKKPVVYVGHKRLDLESQRETVKSNDSMPNSALPITYGKFQFCCTECRDKFVAREKDVESMGPVAFRDGIIQLIRKANPKVPVRDLVRMREEATGRSRNTRIIKNEVREKDTASVKIQEKIVKPPPKEFEALHSGVNPENIVTIEGYVLPTALATDKDLVPASDEEEHDEHDHDDSASQVPSIEKPTPESVQKMEARQIFYGFSDSDDEDLDEEGSSMGAYMSSSSRQFTAYQRLFMTLSRWITDDTLKFLNIHNKQPHRHQLTSSKTLSEERELNKIRKMYDGMDINLDAPREQEGKTTSEIKKPTRKRKPQRNQDDAQKNSVVQQVTESELTPEEREQEVLEEKRFSTHIALNSPNYQRYQVALKQLQSALESALKTLGVVHTSKQHLSQQLDRMLNTMSHDFAAECANDREWEVMCLVLILSLLAAGVLHLDARDEMQRDRVVARVNQLGVPTYHFDALVESASRGF